MKGKTKIGLILVAIMVTVVLNSGCIMDPPPNEFKALYYELLSQMTEFENSLPTPTNESHDPVFAAELLTANSNRGEDLLDPNGIIGVNYELDRLEELGVEGVVIAVNFPLFYPPFHENSSEQEAYLDFYREVAESVDLRGMKLIIESNFIFTQEGISTFNLTDFYNGLSLAEYLSGRLQTVITIADELHPDYLSIVIEPDTEETQTGKPVNDVTIQTEYVNDVLTELENNNITDVKIGAGIGTWHPQYDVFITSFANTDVDFIDTHIYPINRDFFERVLTIADIAHSNGKPITMTEAWLYKTAETELGSVTEMSIFARDVFSFWAPLDQKFIEVIAKLAYAKEFEFVSPFWTKYFYTYLDYDEVSGKSPEELIALSSAEAGKNIVAGKFTSTGLKYKELINEFSNNSPVKSIELFIEKGGRVDWYKGNAHELIAYDTISDDILKNTEVYIVEPDGSGKQCITCDSDIPKGFVGQPAWHPDGEHIIIQVENSNSKHRAMEHVSFGINNDLWIIKKDGTGAKRIWTTDLNHAALHPHFSHDGTKLIFAERIPTGVKIPGMGERTPGGENHWDGWQIKIANFDTETMEIINSTAIKSNGNGFYETNDFYNGEEFTYSFTLNGQPYVDDLYSVKTDGTNVVHIINSSTTWEEHGTFSPAGTGDFVFLSSRFDPTWTAPSSKPDTVALELFLKKTNGDIVQLTEMNKNADLNTRYLVSDYDWDKDGERIVIQIAPIDKRTGRIIDSPQIWMIEFKK